MMQQQISLGRDAWAIGNRGSGYQVYVADNKKVEDISLGYAETLDEAKELVAQYNYC